MHDTAAHLVDRILRLQYTGNVKRVRTACVMVAIVCAGLQIAAYSASSLTETDPMSCVVQPWGICAIVISSGYSGLFGSLVRRIDIGALMAAVVPAFAVFALGVALFEPALHRGRRPTLAAGVLAFVAVVLVVMSLTRARC